MPQTLNKPNQLDRIIRDLIQIPDEVWGEFQFQRDPLKNKIPPAQKRQMIASSIACGIEQAQKFRQQYGDKRIEEIYAELDIPIKNGEEEQIGDRLLFALYEPGRGVLLMENPIKKLAEAQEVPFLSEEEITSFILGHELFHHIESHDETIYTQETKIDLWKFFFYTSRSNVRALSEIAAMSFSKEWHGLTYSPYLLEIILVYPYDPAQAQTMYEEVMLLQESVSR